MNFDANPVQMTKISSMNLFHSIICGLPSSFNVSSNLPIKRCAYAGAILYPLLFPEFVGNICYRIRIRYFLGLYQ